MKKLAFLFALLLWAQTAHAQFFRVDCSDLDSVAINDATECVQTTTASGRIAGRTYLRSGGAWIEKAAVTAVNAQTGTSYTIAHADGRKLVTLSNAAAIAVTLPQAGASSSFLSGWFFDIQNRGAGTATITPTTSTIDGAASLALTTNQGVRIFSDGTNYYTQRGVGGSGSGSETDPVVAAINGIIKSNGVTIGAAVPNTDYAAATHASRHQNGGADEVATATPGANAIPKAGAGGTLDSGWIDQAADYEFTGTTYPETTFASLPAPGIPRRWIWVTDCESTTACSSGGGSIGIWHYDDGTNWIPIFSGQTPSLDQVGAVGKQLAADCSNPFKVYKPGDETTYAEICWDATDAFVVGRVVISGVPDAVNKRVKLTTGHDWCVLNDADECIFKLTEAGVFSGSAIKKTVTVIPFDFGTDVTTGNGKFYWRVATTVDGYSLSNVKVNTITAGTTNATTIGLDRCAPTTSGNVCSGTVTDMLATGYSVDSGENSSDDAATPGALSGTAANLVVTAGQFIRVNVDAVSTTAPKGLSVEMEFAAP